jgi:glycosyltransferase involved in cell wall biosynthesis
MKIYVAGTRGIPGIPGGVETHCEHLYPLIAEKGHEVLIATRSSYVKDNLKTWKRVQLDKCFAPRTKSLEAIVHTFIALLKARASNPDIVHIHAIGPALLIPFARLLGLRVVFTDHGPDYDRQKWGKLAKFILRLGEKWGGRWANEVIVISEVIKNIISTRCKRESNLIYNGVPVPELSKSYDFLNRIGVKPGQYLLAVARFVPEKGLTDLVEAFKQLAFDLQLVIAGDADHESNYSRELKKRAATDDRIILTGYIRGENLNQVFSHARLFVLPSYHEGLPIALLEAMSYGLPVLVSDIPANKEVNLPEECYFRCGDIDSLVDKIKSLIELGPVTDTQLDFRKRIIESYNWVKIADQTINIYKKAICGRATKTV